MQFDQKVVVFQTNDVCIPNRGAQKIEDSLTDNLRFEMKQFLETEYCLGH